MTDARPYRNHTEISVVLAIAQGKPPADLQEIVGPDFLPIVLERCWRLSSETRPTMVWCTEVLSHQTTALFGAYCETSYSHIPAEYRVEGKGWNAILNPELDAYYKYEDIPKLPAALYVISILRRVDSLDATTISLRDARFTPDGQQLAVRSIFGRLGWYGFNDTQGAL